MSLIGSTLPFPATEGQRAAKGDPRRSIAARYCGKAAYLDQVSHAAQSLIDAGYLLPEDLERTLAQSARRWDLLASAPESAAAQEQGVRSQESDRSIPGVVHPAA